MRTIAACFVSLIAITSALGAEVPATIRSIVITADAPKPTGEITVRLTIEDKDGQPQLTGLTVAGNNLKAEAPKDALTHIVRPRAETLAVFVDADKVTFRIVLNHGYAMPSVPRSAEITVGHAGVPLFLQRTWMIEDGKFTSVVERPVSEPASSTRPRTTQPAP